jgi:hypothetical protein
MDVMAPTSSVITSQIAATSSASTVVAVIVAVIAAVAAVASAVVTELLRRKTAREQAEYQDEANKKIEQYRQANQTALEEFKDELGRRRERDTKAEESQALFLSYLDPLLQSAYDLQSRLYNFLRPGGFRGGRDPEYFTLHTLYLFADLLGWMEIIRRDLQFLDPRSVETTRELNSKLEHVRDRMASTSTLRDDLYIYRGQQRAIGELMIIEDENPSARGPRHRCMGYATFVTQQDEPELGRWLGRLRDALSHLPDQNPERLIQLQTGLIDLIDFLDPERDRIHLHRERIRT